MALPSSGSISLSDIASEFSVSAPYSLTDFYRGGGNVIDNTANAGVPTSGAISLTDFYGASATPDATWSIGNLSDVTGEALSLTTTSVSRTATVTNGPIDITVSGASGTALMSVNGGSFLSGTQSVSNGQGIRLRLTTANSDLTERIATASGDGDSLTWSVTTGDFGG